MSGRKRQLKYSQCVPPVKVLFFLGQIPPKTGGEQYDYKLFEYLRSRDLEVLALQVTPAVRDITKRLGRWRKVPYIGRLLVFWLCFRHFKAYRGTVIVANHYFIRELFLYLFLRKLWNRSKVIITLMHYDYYRSNDRFSLSKALTRLKERISFSFVDKVITISHYSRDEILSIGVSPYKVEILPPGLDMDRVSAEHVDTPRDQDSCNILYVGHLYPRKGVIYLIEAMSQLGHRDVKLNIVGDPEKDSRYYDTLKTLVKAKRLEERIIFHGRVEDDKLVSLYQTADICVLPSLQEGFGIVILEAMYFKLPIVASNTAALPELIEDGKNGILVPPRDPKALAVAVNRLIEDSSLRRLMGEEGYRRVANSYSWQKTERRFHEIVKELYQ